MASDLHSSIRKSSIWMIARLGITLTVGAFVTTYIIRSLSVVDYGVYALLYSLTGYVSVIASFGMPSVFQRFLPEAMQKKDYGLLKQLVLRGLLLRLILSVITVLVILYFNGPIGRFLKVDGWMSYFSVFAWGIVIYLEASLLTDVLHSLFLHKYSVISSTLYTVFRGVCVFVVLKLHLGIQGVLWAEVAAWGVWSLMQLYFYYALFLRLHPENERSRVPLRRYFRYGGLSSLNELGNTVLGVSTDFFVITAFLGPGAVAFYAFADRVIRLMMHCLPHITLIDVIRPSFFTKYAESGSKQQLADMFNLLVKIGAFFVFPLVTGVFVLGGEMISIVFKPDYLSAKPILLTMMVFTAINIFAQPAGLVLKAMEQVQVIMFSKVFAVYNLIADILVIQRFGVMGVVLVTCSAHLMTNLFLYYFAKKYGALQIDWRGILVVATNAAAMAIAVWFLRPMIAGFLSLFLVSLVGAAVYFISSWLNKAFTAKERILINRVIPKPVFVF